MDCRILFRRRVLGGSALCCLLLAGMSLQLGCEPYGAVAGPDVDTVSIALPAHFGSGSARLFLYRITSRRTGERLGVGRDFRVEERRQVRAVLQMDGLKAGEELLLHVMWLNPDGTEVYTKEISVQREDWESEARRDSLAADLLILNPAAGSLELESRYGVSPDRFDEQLHKTVDRRTFKTGRWEVRVYLYRKLLLETSFDLLPAEY